MTKEIAGMTATKAPPARQLKLSLNRLSSPARPLFKPLPQTAAFFRFRSQLVGTFFTLPRPAAKLLQNLSILINILI
jgi:hypothetical protein